jgi:predicted nucleic acid-binding protein
LIVVDSSAWIEHFRETGSSAHLAVRALLRQRAQIAVTEVVVMELLAGVTRPGEAGKFLGGFTMLPLRGLRDFEHAAALYRSCRTTGETVRKLSDCLVAVPTIRAGATLLHADRDFDVLARHTPLRLEPLVA